MTGLPVFNAAFAYWVSGHSAAVDPADGILDAQLYLLSKQTTDITPAVPDQWHMAVIIRVPDNFHDVVGGPLVNMQLGWQDPYAFTWYYVVRSWEYCHAGFSNSYIALLVDQCEDNRNVPDSNR